MGERVSRLLPRRVHALGGVMVIETRSMSLVSEMSGYFTSKSKVRGWGGTWWMVVDIQWEILAPTPILKGGFYGRMELREVMP